jgi:hypothetical protein
MRALKALRAENHEQAKLYETLVERQITPAEHRRNEALTKLAPFLYKAVSGPAAKDLAEIMLRINAGIYSGTTMEHMNSFESLWAGCEEKYPSELNAKEAAIYAELEEGERPAFRICRDLAQRRGGEFFMPCDKLEVRVRGISGWRMLKNFCSLEIIEQTKPGQKRAKGTKALAATFRWKLAEFRPAAEPAQDAAA